MIKKIRYSFLYPLIILLLASADDCSIKRTIVVFNENEIELTTDNKVEIKKISEKIEKIAETENYSEYEVQLTARSTADEYHNNKYIGVNRALNVRNEMMNTLKELKNYDFYISDYGVTKFPDERGIQVNIVSTGFN